MTDQNVDSYIAAQPEPQQQLLREIRTIVKEIIPDGQEAIAYAIPTMRSSQGKNIVHYAGFHDHIGLYPIPEGLEQEVEPYRAGKGTLQFALDKPLPTALITEVVTRLAQRIQ